MVSLEKKLRCFVHDNIRENANKLLGDNVASLFYEQRRNMEDQTLPVFASLYWEVRHECDATS